MQKQAFGSGRCSAAGVLGGPVLALQEEWTLGCRRVYNVFLDGYGGVWGCSEVPGKRGKRIVGPLRRLECMWGVSSSGDYTYKNAKLNFPHYIWRYMRLFMLNFGSGMSCSP